MLKRQTASRKATCQSLTSSTARRTQTLAPDSSASRRFLIDGEWMRHGEGKEGGGEEAGREGDVGTCHYQPNFGVVSLGQ